MRTLSSLLACAAVTAFVAASLVAGLAVRDLIEADLTEHIEDPGGRP